MEAWEKFLSLQETELGIETVRKWLRPLKIVRFDARNLYLQASDTFHVLWFEEHIRQKVESTLVNNNNHRIKVTITLNGETPPSKKKKTSKLIVKETQPIAPAKFAIQFDSLDPLNTFSNYVTPTTSPLPLRVLMQSIEGLLQNNIEFNPIYLCGPKGSGKTHLLMSTAHALQVLGLNVAYVRAETFTEHVVTAIRAGEMSLFRQSYRNADVLFIDDIHILGNKWATQEELFHTFNTLHLAGKQIILSADSLPHSLQNIEQRLVSRFEWGIVLSLETLQGEQLAEMLDLRAKALRYSIHQKVAAFLIETFKSSPRAIVRALDALILRTHLKKNSLITVPVAQNLLADLIAEEEQNALDPMRVIQTVSKHFGIRTEDVIGKTQTREFVQARQIAMFLCRTQLQISFVKIGNLFSKDHTTVMSGVRQIQKSIDKSDVLLIDHIRLIKNQLLVDKY